MSDPANTPASESQANGEAQTATPAATTGAQTGEPASTGSVGAVGECDGTMGTGPADKPDPDVDALKAQILAEIEPAIDAAVNRAVEALVGGVAARLESLELNLKHFL